MLKQSDLENLIPGLDGRKYFHGWALLAILWRGLWFGSRTDWSRYRKTIWDQFGGWVVSSARRSRDLGGFMAAMSRYENLTTVGGNEDERQIVLMLLALPEQEQRRIINQYRNDSPVLIAFLRQWRDVQKQELNPGGENE